MIVKLTLDLELLDGEEQSFAVMEAALREELEGMYIGTETSRPDDQQSTDYVMRIKDITQGD